MNKKPNILIRWRWATTVGAALEIYSTAYHYVKHDVSGWPVPGAFVLPLLTVGAVSICALAIMTWVAYFYGRARRGG